MNVYAYGPYVDKVFKETRPQLVLLEDSYKKEHDRVVAIAGSNHVNNLRELLRRGIKNSFGDVRVMKGYEV
jgi:hypothetical protein